MKQCDTCDRSFVSECALAQHIRDSPAHIPSIDCEICDRSFVSEGALAQHIRDSPAHIPSIECETCDRSFVSEEALAQHIRDSPAHIPSIECETCDRSFVSEEALAQHIRDSPAHIPSIECETCDRSFVSEEALAQHIRDSPAHIPSIDCETCDRSFVSEEALAQHIRDSSAHTPHMEQQQHLRDFPRHNVRIQWANNLNLETNLPLHQSHYITKEISVHNSRAEETRLEYLGVPRSVIGPIFKLARHLRFQEPTVEMIVSKTKTSLDHAIIFSLIAAALRLLPVDNTPQGIAARSARERLRAAHAKRAEVGLFAEFTRLGYDCVDEEQQKETSNITPDILFRSPTYICGHLCLWLEYKNFFGFRSNPFVGPRNKKQFQKYAEHIGPGAVVYKLGFETGLVDIEGVKILREAEVRQDLGMQVAPVAN